MGSLQKVTHTPDCHIRLHWAHARGMKASCLVSSIGLCLALCLASATATYAQRAVINDPDGYTNVRTGQSSSSAIVAKVKAGEIFEFESGGDSEWRKVTLASGKTGWMHVSRIRLYHTLDELPEKDDENSELAYFGQGHGFAYCPTARAAAQGDPAAMKRFFGINDMDGAAAEGHAFYMSIVMHVLGDEKLAAFLKDQPLEYRLDARREMVGGFELSPCEINSYAERNFPQTVRLVCRKEITDWTSPDGKYAVLKVFSEARVMENSKVVKAQLIEKATGKSVLDLTKEDVGQGSRREGNVMWSPDGKRFAYFSGDVGIGAQTAVYEKNGASFTKMNLPAVELPGRKGDAELKGADRLWVFVEPRKWETPDVLVILQHEYFEKLREDRSINSIGRTYLITNDLAKGTATARLQKHDGSDD